MEVEAFFSGYCRQQNQSRVVAFTYEVCGGSCRLCEADCLYHTCPFTDECTVAQQAEAKQQELRETL